MAVRWLRVRASRTRASAVFGRLIIWTQLSSASCTRRTYVVGMEQGLAQVRDELVRKNMAAASAFPWAH